MKIKLAIIGMMMVAQVMAQGVLAQGVIDVHGHYITADYLAVLEKHNALLDEGYPLPEWSDMGHLMFMNAAGVGTSIVTMPAPHPYFGDIEETKDVIHKVNAEGARLKFQYPARFLFFAALPLPDVQAAIEEAVYALDELGANGVKLATNVAGQYLGDPALDPLMEVLNERNAIIIIHPQKPVPYSDDLLKGVPLAMNEYLAESTRAVANMLTHNVLTRYPNLRVVIPHCGAYLPLAVPRMKSVYPAAQNAGLVEEIDWDGQLSHLYYDLAGAASPEVIKMMLTITDISHIFYGSDFPYATTEVLKRNLGILRMNLLNDEELSPHVDDIFSRNFIKLLKNE